MTEPNPLDELLAGGGGNSLDADLGIHPEGVWAIDHEGGEREWFLDEPGGLWHQARVAPARVEPVGEMEMHHPMGLVTPGHVVRVESMDPIEVVEVEDPEHGPVWVQS